MLKKYATLLVEPLLYINIDIIDIKLNEIQILRRLQRRVGLLDQLTPTPMMIFLVAIQ